MATVINHFPGRAHGGWTRTEEQQPSPSQIKLILKHTLPPAEL